MGTNSMSALERVEASMSAPGGLVGLVQQRTRRSYTDILASLEAMEPLQTVESFNASRSGVEMKVVERVEPIKTRRSYVDMLTEIDQIELNTLEDFNKTRTGGPVKIITLH